MDSGFCPTTLSIVGFSPWEKVTLSTTDGHCDCSSGSWHPSLGPCPTFPNRFVGTLGYCDSAQDYVEYLGQCLPTPLQVGNTYSISFDFGHFNGIGDNPICIFGFHGAICPSTPVTPSTVLTGDLGTAPGWTTLATFTETSSQNATSWDNYSVTFTTVTEISYLAFGECVAGNTADSPCPGSYFLWDNFCLSSIPNCNVSFSFTQTDISCHGAADGVATVSILTGVPPFNYIWSNNSTAPTISGLSAQKYAVTVIDANECRSIDQITINEPPALQLTLTTASTVCSGTVGTATATVGGGTPGYTYSWSSSQNGPLGQTTPTIFGPQGTYTVTVTDMKGCEITDSVLITVPDPLTVVFDVTNVGCDSIDDGMVSAINVGGTAPISYQWNSGHTGPTASNLATGVYTVTLLDANGCKAIAGTTVNSQNCESACQPNPCLEAIITNLDICTLLMNTPGDPLATLDCDGDGVINTTECMDNTDPLDPCDYLDTSITLPVIADQTDCPIPCPDLTPVTTILPGNIAGASTVEAAIKVVEVNNVDSDGTVISLRIPSDPRLLFVWNIGLTQAANIPVQNSDWNYLGDNGIIHNWEYNASGLILNAGASTAIGFQAVYDPQSTNGQTTITATVVPFSGGDCNFINNTDSERLVYFK